MNSAFKRPVCLQMFVIPLCVVSLWYWDINLKIKNTHTHTHTRTHTHTHTQDALWDIVQSQRTQTQTEQKRQTQALDCNSSTLQIHVTLQPSPDYLSPFYGSCYQAEQPGKTWPKVKFMSKERKDIQERRVKHVCLRAIPSLKIKKTQVYAHVTQAHRSLTTRQYPQSLIKWAFDRNPLW